MEFYGMKVLKGIRKHFLVFLIRCLTKRASKSREQSVSLVGLENGC